MLRCAIAKLPLFIFVWQQAAMMAAFRSEWLGRAAGIRTSSRQGGGSWVAHDLVGAESISHVDNDRCITLEGLLKRLS
jgi:hypothetical protein